jgi:uncharacterized protein
MAENDGQAPWTVDQSHAHGAASEQGGLAPAELERVRSALRAELAQRPPTIGVIGVSGVGKSFTLNTLFNTGLETSDTIACTKDFLAVELTMTSGAGRTAGLDVPLRVVDAPGLGEDIHRDAHYLRAYEEHLEECDVVLWISAARNRAVSLDQTYLRALSEFQNKMVFAVNQVDLIEPMDWNEQINLPSEEQMAKIDEIVVDRRDRLQSILEDDEVHLEPYSAKKRFRLQSLFTALLNAMPEDRAWVYADLKNFEHDDFVPREYREMLTAESDEDHRPTQRGRPRLWSRRRSNRDGDL